MGRFLCAVILVFLINYSDGSEAATPTLKFESTPLTWTEAKDYCKNSHGVMAKIQGNKVEKVLMDAIVRGISNEGKDKIIIWTNNKTNPVYEIKVYFGKSRQSNAGAGKIDPDKLPFYCEYDDGPPTTKKSAVSTTLNDATDEATSVSEPPSLITTSTTFESKCCHRTDRLGLTWERTCGDVKINQSCPPPAQNGTAVWSCNGTTGQWYPSSPDLSSCKSPVVNDILNKIDLSDIPGTYNYLSEAASNAKAGGDVIAIEDIINDVTSSLENKNNLTAEEWLDVVENVTDAMADTMNSFLNSSEMWNGIPETKRLEKADRLLSNINKVGFTLAHAMNDSQHTVEKENFFLQAIKGPRGTFANRNLTLPLSESNSSSLDISMTLNSGFEEDLMRMGEKIDPGYTIVLFTILQNMEEVLLMSNRRMLKNSTVTTKVNSPVVSLSLLEDSNVSMSLTNEMNFVLPREEAMNANSAICAFWNVTRRTWDDGGCQLVASNDTHTTCACNHLTNFAILMDVHGVVAEFSKSDIRTLTIITYVGCSISILSLAICVFLTTAFRQLWCIRNTINRNLSACLLIAEVLLITGLKRTEDKVACSVVAGFLHFFFLAAFFWMFLEAAFLYILLSKVFAQRKTYANRYYLFGYGLPLLIVAISYGANPEGYGTENHCFLSSENGMMWSFGALVLVIVLINFIVLIIAMRKAVVMNKKKADDYSAKQWIYGSMTLVPILGLTWVVGFLTWNNSVFGVVSAYAFTILNSLQGLSIFVVQILMNKKAMALIRRRLPGKFRRVTTMSKSGSSNQRTGSTSDSPYYKSVRKISSDRSRASVDSGRSRMTKSPRSPVALFRDVLLKEGFYDVSTAQRPTENNDIVSYETEGDSEMERSGVILIKKTFFESVL